MSAFATAYVYVGIEELGVQIEEPFSILPMEAFCDASIGNVLTALIASDTDAVMIPIPQYPIYSALIALGASRSLPTVLQANKIL